MKNDNTVSRTALDINDMSAEQEFELLGATQDVDRKRKSNLDQINEESGSKTATNEGSPNRQKERDADNLQIIE